MCRRWTTRPTTRSWECEYNDCAAAVAGTGDPRDEARRIAAKAMLSAFVRGKLAQDRSALIEDLLLGAGDGIDKALPEVTDKSDCPIDIGVAWQAQRRVILCGGRIWRNTRRQLQTTRKQSSLQ